MSWGVGHRCCSDPLLWLWCRPVATALIGSLAWEPPYDADVALKRQKDTHKLNSFMAWFFQICFPLFSSTQWELGTRRQFLRVLVLFFGVFFLVFLGPCPWHTEVPRVGESELQLLAYTTYSNVDPSHICDLHHSSWQLQILNPLIKAKTRTQVLKDTSQFRYH